MQGSFKLEAYYLLRLLMLAFGVSIFLNVLLIIKLIINFYYISNLLLSWTQLSHNYDFKMTSNSILL